MFSADGHCSLSDISVGQNRTTNWAHGMPVWSVNITNNCACSRLEVKLNCFGFKTNLGVDPSILSVSENECLLKNGQPVGPFETVNFLYAWDFKFPFQPISAKIACS